MASAQAKHVTGNLLKEQLFGQLCSSSLLSLALDPSIELLIERAFAHLCCVTVPLLIEFITPTCCNNLLHNNLLHTNLLYTNLVHTNLVHTKLLHTNLLHTNLVYNNLIHNNLVHNLIYNNFIHNNLMHNNLVHSNLFLCPSY